MLTTQDTLPLADLILTGWLPSWLKKALYRAKGYRIGRNVKLEFGSVIVGRSVEIGDKTKIGLLTVVRGRNIKIGPRVKIGMMTAIDCPVIAIGEGTRINNQVVIGGMTTPDSAFKIGRNCILMEWSFVNTTLPVTIGDDVGIGGHCLFFTHGMWPNTFEGFPAKYAPITIGDQAWLAWRVSVLPGVTIGPRTIISSDACVVKDIPAGALAAGVPAKLIQENEAFVAPHDAVRNEGLLRQLMVEFQRWLDFNGIKSRWAGRSVIEVEGRKGVSHKIWLREPGASDVGMSATPADVIISCALLDESTRSRFDAAQTPWLDVSGKRRSQSTNDVADEVEKYLQRAGLRFLMYSTW
ncbi:MAG: hypothetical protein HXY23_12155 [Parvularculaceae bacterium]|nr:hypothetical protein [Parvularculaceae bacterium]